MLGRKTLELQLRSDTCLGTSSSLCVPSGSSGLDLKVRNDNNEKDIQILAAAGPAVAGISRHTQHHMLKINAAALEQLQRQPR